MHANILDFISNGKLLQNRQDSQTSEILNFEDFLAHAPSHTIQDCSYAVLFTVKLTLDLHITSLMCRQKP